ncbi:nucleoside-diphosphate sugar epimerase, partial [Rhizobium ruizarguesonis]
VELVDVDWNDSAAIEQALKGVEGAFVMLPPFWAPSPDYKEAKGVIANYVEALTKAVPPRVVVLPPTLHEGLQRLSLRDSGLRPTAPRL